MKLKLSIVPILALLIVGCASLGIDPPQSFDQKLAYAQGVDTSVLTASTAAVRAGQITADDHEHVIKIAEQAKALIDSARALAFTDPTAANAKLQLATAVLTEIQAFLNSRKKVA